jgi:CDP-4-dehydro-6-deoxyglucose reductase
MSTHFHNLKVGDHLKLQGPLGKFGIVEPIQHDLAFVATGTGIAPLRGMMFDLYHCKKVSAIKVWCFLGVRYEDEILFWDEFKKLEGEHSNFKFVPTISRPKNWSGEVGYVQEKVKKYLTSPKDVDIYACGLVDMIENTLKALSEAGFPPEQLHYEKWT